MSTAPSFAQSNVPFPTDAIEQSISARFEQQVERHAGRLAVADDSGSFTYRSLNELANKIGHTLRHAPVEAGSGRVVIHLESGALYIAAILGTLKAGHAYVPTDPSFPEGRNAYIVENVGAKVILTNGRHFAQAQRLAGHTATVINLDALSEDTPVHDLGLTVSPDALAFIIYTSGATGRPRGVMQNHENALHGCMRRTNLQRITPEDRMTLFYSCSVMGSVHCILGALLNGASLFPYDLREKGVAGLGPWLASREITIHHSVPSVFREFAKRHRGNEAYSVRLVIFGGERVLATDVELARKVFSPEVEFFTGLGSTETGTVRYFGIGPETKLDGKVVPLGYPVDGMDVVLVGEDGVPVRDGEVGEITVRSRYLALGYWNDAEATERVFRPVPGAPSLRVHATGDLGELDGDGLLRHRGRKDLQVKIRGFRVEVSDVEAALLEHPSVEAAVVAAQEAAEETRLVTYLVTSAELGVRSLRQHLLERLPRHMVPALYVRLEAIPRTPSGEVDRRALPAPEGATQLASDVRVPPETETERALVALCAELLGCEPDQVSVNYAFLELGGDSLNAARLVARVHERLRRAVPVRKVFEAPDLKALARYIETSAQPVSEGQDEGLRVEARDRRLPVSFAQRRLWVIDQLHAGSCAYNISNSVRLDGDLNVSALERALSEMVVRHEILRTRFLSDDDGPWQVIDPPQSIELPQIDLRGSPHEERESRALALVQEFSKQAQDLTHGPLFRCTLIRLEQKRSILVLVWNHIIHDDIWSSGVFFRELGVLYRAFSTGQASPLQPLRFQFADFAAWERRRSQQGELQPHLDYWRRQLASLPEPLQVPGDRVRPDTPSLAGGQVVFELSAALSAALTQLSRAESATTFMTLLTAWQLFLHRYTEQADIVVGTPTGRRHRTETEGMLGLFINHLVMRTTFSNAPTFRQLLRQVRQTAIDAFTHDELPFEDLVAALSPGHTTDVAPLFQHLFIHQSTTHDKWTAPGLDITPVQTHPGGSNFDLTLQIVEDGERLSGALEYSSDLFEHATAERMVRNLLTLLQSAVDEPDRPVWQLEMLTKEDRKLVRERWNQTATDYPKHLHAQELFEQRVAERPDAIALVSDDHTFSYDELNRRANQLANHLRRLGVGPDRLVAVCMERSFELVVALLGVLKAGGAYVPLDPKFPPDRLAYMVENSEAKVCISEPSVIDKLVGLDAEVVLLEATSPLFDSAERDNPAVEGTPDDLAYVIYTSGSTGKPKGVQVTHRGLVNFLCSMQREPGIDAGDVIHSLTTICFDIAALEIFLPLASGAKVVVKPQKTSLDPLQLLASIKQHGATIVQATPVTWRMLLDHGWNGSPRFKVLCGGEAMGPDLAEKLIATGCEVWNMYGPTETTIWSSVRRVRQKADAANIGLPIANTEFLVCSPQLTLQPIGVPGELLIGGDGLARGYLRLEDKTKERFIAHPFESGQRLYRTGDLVVRRANGDIEFLGRMDNQVKIRGFRIELGEIEAHLGEHPDVKQAVVIAREDTQGDKRLVAYLVMEGAGTDAAALREYMRQLVPEYMVPSAFVALPQFPLTPNGKVDRKQLPAPVDPAPAAPRSRRPRGDGETTAKLAEIFEAATKAPLSSLSDNFFDVGGHSMAAISAVAAINQRFGLDLPPTFLFDFPTVEKLAKAIEELRSGEHTEDELRAPRLSAAELAQVDAILNAVRASGSAKALPDQPPRMLEAPICKHVLARLYPKARRSVRAALKHAILKAEGGSGYSITMRKLFKQCYDIEIGDFSSVPFEMNRLQRGTKIGKFCSIYRTAIFQNADHPRNTLATHGLFYHRDLGFTPGYELPRVRIEVGHDVWIGDGAKILYPTKKIGHGAIVAAGAVVVEDVPPYAIVAGYPAQVVRYRFSREVIERLLELRWWDKPFEELHRVRDAFMKPLEGDRIR